jgi:1-acyl-sn-glycerol-3-phosphate acyltransferase
MRTAIGHLEAGGRIGVFPEGRRVAAWGEDPPKRGAAWLSLRTGAPLLPVAVWGTDRAMPIGDNTRIHRAPISAVVGRAVEPDDYLDHVDPIGAITEAWRRQMDEELTYLAGRAGETPAAG